MTTSDVIRTAALNQRSNQFELAQPYVRQLNQAQPGERWQGTGRTTLKWDGTFCAEHQTEWSVTATLTYASVAIDACEHRPSPAMRRAARLARPACLCLDHEHTATAACTDCGDCCRECGDIAYQAWRNCPHFLPAFQVATGHASTFGHDGRLAYGMESSR